MSEQNTNIQTLLNEINSATDNNTRVQKLTQLSKLMSDEINNIIKEEFSKKHKEDDKDLDDEEEEEKEEDLDGDEEDEEKKEDLDGDEEDEEGEAKKKKKKKENKIPTLSEIVKDDEKFATLSTLFYEKFGYNLRKTNDGASVLFEQGAGKPAITFTILDNGLVNKEITYKQKKEEQEKKKEDNTILIIILVAILTIALIGLAIFLIKHSNEKQKHEQEISDRRDALEEGVVTKEKDNSTIETEKVDTKQTITDANGNTQYTKTESTISTSAGSVERSTAATLAEQLESQNSGATLNGVSIRDIEISKDGSVTYYDVLSPRAHTTTVDEIRGNLMMNGSIVSDDVLTIAQNRTQDMSSGNVTLSNISAITSYNDDTKTGTIQLLTGGIDYGTFNIPNLGIKDNMYTTTKDGVQTAVDPWQQQILMNAELTLDNAYPTTKDFSLITMQ